MHIINGVVVVVGGVGAYKKPIYGNKPNSLDGLILI